MSESNALFSQKGPLGDIWMAAYFFRKLKKKQIASTDISTSIDKILPDPEIPYRILTLLLLGVAKIYAKKVELLYEDCNEALTNINKASINRPLMLPDEVIGTSQHKVSEKGKASVSLETTPLAGAICEPYRGASIIIPNRLELDSFDLGIPEDGDTSHEDHNIEDAWTADGSPRNCFNECYHSQTTHAGLISGLTLLDDVLPPYMMDIDEEISKFYKSDDSDAGGDEFGGDSDCAEDCSDYENMVARDILDSPLLNMETTNQEHSKNLDETISKIIHNNLQDDQSEIHVEPMDLSETKTSKCGRDIAPEVPTEDKTPVETQTNIIRGKDRVITSTNKERFQLLKKKNYFFDEVSMLSDNSQFGMSNLRRNRKRVPYARLDIWKACRSANVKQGFLQPLLIGMSPELKALYKDKLTNPFSLKRSSEFANEQTRPSPHATEPVDLQDVDGLIDLENVTEPINMMNLAELVDQINVAEPVNLQNAAEPVDLEDVTGPVDMQIDSSDNPFDNFLTQGQSLVDILSTENPFTSTDMELYDMNAKSTEPSFSDSELDALDGDQDSDGGYSNQQQEDNDDGLSDKTSEVAQFLHKKLASKGNGEEQKSLNLSSVLQGGTRAMSAKFFYETLALKSLGCIDTTQESPYGDIVVSATPQLEKMINKR